MPGQFFGRTVSLKSVTFQAFKRSVVENCSVIPKEESIIYWFHMLSLQLGRWCCPRRIYSRSSCQYPQWERDTWGSQSGSSDSRPRRPLGICSTLPLPENLAGWKQPVGNHKHTHTRDERGLIRNLLQLECDGVFWLLKSDRCQTLLIQTFTLARHATAASIMRAHFSPHGVDATLLTKWHNLSLPNTEIAQINISYK